MTSLNSKSAREQWEREFNMHYIQPILSNLNAHVNEAMTLVADDEHQGIICTMYFDFFL